MTIKNRLGVIFPGRGSYGPQTQGKIIEASKKFTQEMDIIEKVRREFGETPLLELDRPGSFQPEIHLAGEHASLLTFTASLFDFLELKAMGGEIVAVTGNSLGWYTTLGCGGAIEIENCARLIQGMGSMMKKGLIGQQMMTQVCDEKWIHSDEKKLALEQLMERSRQKTGLRIFDSIYLGGYRVLGGDSGSVDWLMKNSPKEGDIPQILKNHGAFHTPLMMEISQQALNSFPPSLFHSPKIPLVDGRGEVWYPLTSHPQTLLNYTLGAQVTEPYHFTKAIQNLIREFAPDYLVLMGPGESLGGAIAQSLIELNWQGFNNRLDFSAKQKEKPYLLNFVRPNHRALLNQG